ncbi:MAG: hypothetical protein AAFV88_21190 [Planctomycetota bacterium]
MKCMQCQSERLVRDVQAVDYFDMAAKQPLKLELDANPEAWIFKGTTGGELRASVCTECGFVMFSMAKEDAERLYKLQQDAKR